MSCCLAAGLLCELLQAGAARHCPRAHLPAGALSEARRERAALQPARFECAAGRWQLHGARRKTFSVRVSTSFNALSPSATGKHFGTVRIESSPHVHKATCSTTHRQKSVGNVEDTSLSRSRRLPFSPALLPAYLPSLYLPPSHSARSLAPSLPPSLPPRPGYRPAPFPRPPAFLSSAPLAMVLTDMPET